MIFFVISEGANPSEVPPPPPLFEISGSASLLLKKQAHEFQILVQCLEIFTYKCAILTSFSRTADVSGVVTVAGCQKEIRGC
jgi:hypothetical protein